MDAETRFLNALDHDEVVRVARARAEDGRPLHPHNFDVGSTQAVTYERAFHARERELRAEVEA